MNFWKGFGNFFFMGFSLKKSLLGKRIYFIHLSSVKAITYTYIFKKQLRAPFFEIINRWQFS